MRDSDTMKIIARIRSEFPEKFGIPRQSGLVEELKADIIFEPEYRNPDALRGIEEYSHIWLIWKFSESVTDTFRATVRPPRLGGNVRKGVFATRSPFRPNAIGLSCVRLLGVTLTGAEGPVLHVAGADLMDRTPIYDIKPYLPAVDSHPDAVGGFADRVFDYALVVRCPKDLEERIPKERRAALYSVLSQDPRPSYQEDPERIYGMAFAGLEVKFTVREGILTICGVSEQGN